MTDVVPGPLDSLLVNRVVNIQLFDLNRCLY